MQIGPSLSVLQALGSQPSAPAPAKLQASAHVEATAETRRAVEQVEVAGDRALLRPAAAEHEGSASAGAAAAPGRRLDIMV